MPASLAPITPELLAGFRDGKESALEQLFRSNFDALTKEAAETLEDVAASQKVVAGTFLELWDKRGQAHSASQLEAMLRQALGAGVTHEQRRRSALHRMADADGDHKQHGTSPQHHHEPESSDSMWAHIASELHAEKGDPKLRAERLAARQRHGAATHIAHVAQPKSSKMIVFVVLVLAVIVAVPLWLLNKGAEATKAEQALGRNDTRPMMSKPGQRGKVTLEDSTAVFMGANSTVTLTAHFPQDFRAARVTGTASFNAPAGPTPLLIQVGGAWVSASGAEFVVRHFDDDSTAMIKAITGSVSVKGDVLERTLNAGEVLQVSATGVMSDLPADRAAEAFGWVDDNFVIQNQPLKQVLVALKRWYGLEITALDTSLNQRPVTMTASLASSKAAIAAFEESAGVKVGYEGQKMVVKDTVPGAATKKKR